MNIPTDAIYILKFINKNIKKRKHTKNIQDKIDLLTVSGKHNMVTTNNQLVLDKKKKNDVNTIHLNNVLSLV